MKKDNTIHDSLQAARRQADLIRFSGDARAGDKSVAAGSGAAKDFFLINELQIAQAVTPSLHSSLDAALANLLIPSSVVTAFVYPSSEIQAMCIAGGENGCVIRFSSAMANIMDDEELKFIAGHELGHFLLKHHSSIKAAEQGGLEYFMQRRAQEISCDRMGLIACGFSLDTAIKALMKTVSGLTGEHIRVDLGAFLSQLPKELESSLINEKSTHPSILVRCRALVWFSLNDCFANYSGNFSTKQLSALNEKIQKDLSKYVDGPARKQIQEAKEKVGMWMIVYAIVQDNVFEKREQQWFADIYGDAKLEKIKGFLGGPLPEIKNAVKGKLEEAKNNLKELIPAGYESEMAAIQKQQNLIAIAPDSRASKKL